MERNHRDASTGDKNRKSYKTTFSMCGMAVHSTLIINYIFSVYSLHYIVLLLCIGWARIFEYNSDIAFC